MESLILDSSGRKMSEAPKLIIADQMPKVVNDGKELEIVEKVDPGEQQLKVLERPRDPGKAPSPEMMARLRAWVSAMQPRRGKHTKGRTGQGITKDERRARRKVAKRARKANRV